MVANSIEGFWLPLAVGQSANLGGLHGAAKDDVKTLREIADYLEREHGRA
jgi:hypothetical protein